MIFELYYMPRYESSELIFPNSMLDTYDTIEEMRLIHQFTDNEIDSLLRGDIVRKKFFIDIAYKFFNDMEAKQTALENPDGLKLKQIAEINKCRVDTNKKVLAHALNSMKQDKILKQFLYNVQLLKQIRKRKRSTL